MTEQEKNGERMKKKTKLTSNIIYTTHTLYSKRNEKKKKL